MRLSPEASEILLAIDNAEPWYNRKMYMWRNLCQKVKRGTFDPAKAPKLFYYLVSSVSKYMKDEYGWTVSTAAKKEVAEALTQEFLDELDAIRRGHYDLTPRTPQVVRGRKGWY